MDAHVGEPTREEMGINAVRNIRQRQPVGGDVATERSVPSQVPNPIIRNGHGGRNVRTNGAANIIKLCTPVSLCIFVVVTTINSVDFYNVTYTPVYENSSDNVTKIWNALANSLILVVVIVTSNILMITLYIKRCYKCIRGLFLMAFLYLLFCTSHIYFKELLRAYNIPMDYFTAFLIMWNFVVAGMMSIHWHGPLSLQQAYLIFMTAVLALIYIKYLPEWTTWVVLAVISIWDVIAVLSPHGPLRKMVETAEERNDEVFAAITYSTSIPDSRSQASERGVQLGLGDFVFYSILVGKVSSYGDWNTTIACFVVILIGITITTQFLTGDRKALPGLPISIFLGLFFGYIMNAVGKPFAEKLLDEEVFI